MSISFKDKIEEVQGKQLEKILSSNLSNIPKACKKMGFTPLKEIDGVHVANNGKVFDSIIVGSANSKSYAIMVRKGGDFVPIIDPEDKMTAFLDKGFEERLNKSQKVAAVAAKVAELLK